MKKKLMMALSLVLVAAMSIGGTVAYLTSTTGLVENTFTVGDVAITLDEAKVTEMGVKDGDTRVKENTYKLIPGHTYTKDPTIHVVANSEPCYLFVKVVNGIEGIEAEGTTTIAKQMEALGWVELPYEADVYYYDTMVPTATTKQDFKVFESFKIDGEKDVSASNTATITIMGYAVQADGFDTAAEAWEAAPSSWTAPSEAPAS